MTVVDGAAPVELNGDCFLRGTRFATPAGEIAVEKLAVGDRVLTLSGETRPITWIGTGRRRLVRGQRCVSTPVIVRKGALADNVPYRDLRVTKGHSLYLDGALIPVEFLVNHRSIMWDDWAQDVIIHHVQLETHDVLIADGAPAESYRDEGDRWLFQDASAGWHALPQPPCAPVLTGGPVVDAIWRRLLDRSGPRCPLPLTADANLHLRVNGRRIDASSRHGSAHVFAVPAERGDIRIGSRAASPQELGLARDPRCLGVALRSITVRQGAEVAVVAAEDARLAEGYHEFEPEQGFRWTDGDAVVPQALLSGATGPMELVLYVAGTAQYLDEGERCLAA